MTDQPQATEIGVRAARAELAELLHQVSVYGRTFYITSRGRRVAAIVPVPVAEQAERDSAGPIDH